MDAAIHDKIAHHAEADHEVGAEEAEVVIENEIEAIQGCSEQQASGDKEESAMQFGLLAPCGGSMSENAC